MPSPTTCAASCLHSVLLVGGGFGKSTRDKSGFSGFQHCRAAPLIPFSLKYSVGLQLKINQSTRSIFISLPTCSSNIYADELRMNWMQKLRFASSSAFVQTNTALHQSLDGDGATGSASRLSDEHSQPRVYRTSGALQARADVQHGGEACR